MDGQYNCSNSEGLKGQLCCYFCKFLSFEITHFSQIFLQISFQEVGSSHNEGTYDERQRAIRQSNFGKRQRGGKDAVENCRLLFCYILTPITVLIEAVNVSMGKVVRIQSLLFVQPLLLCPPISSSSRWCCHFLRPYFHFPCNNYLFHRSFTLFCLEYLLERSLSWSTNIKDDIHQPAWHGRFS